jgi:hypothetical protein
MKKASPISRSNAIILAESIVWIIITFFTRSRLDLLAARWQLAEVWVFLLKIGVVLALIAIAVALHGVLFRWLARLGVIPAEEKKG